MSYDAVRDAAIDVLLRVFEKHAFLSESLDKTLRRKALSDRGSRFLTQLVYGTVRHLRLCDHILNRRVEQPLSELPRPIHAIIIESVKLLACDALQRLQACFVEF